MNKLLLTYEVVGDMLKLKVSGQIDEGAVYDEIPKIGYEQVALDLEGVSLIDSTGLQKWIKFIQTMPGRLILEKCSMRVVSQLNMFPGFLASKSTHIRSFFAPFFCDRCELSCEVLLSESENFPIAESSGKLSAPQAFCPKCKGNLEFDGIEKKYFAFLSYRQAS